jgi:Ca-activated chloride channel family protein
VSAPLSFQLLGAPARLADPGALWLLAAVAALAALGGAALWRRAGLLDRSTGPQRGRVAPTANLARPVGRLGLSLTGLALFALALSRPQCGTRTELTRRAGVDVVVALDVSASMQARDLKPDRLSRATLEVGELLGQLAGDRIGIVVFAGEAFVQCPLTSDAGAARLFLRTVGPGSVPQAGSDLGNALDASQEVLEAAEGGAGRSRVVLLVSDGEDHEGRAAAAAARLAEAGTRVFALGVGERGGGPIPLLDRSGSVTGYKKDRRGQPVVTRLDEATLRAVAEQGGGALLELGSPDRGLPAFRAALDAMEKSELEGRLAVLYEDRYAAFAFPGLLSLLAALLLAEARPARPAGGEDA